MTMACNGNITFMAREDLSGCLVPGHEFFLLIEGEASAIKDSNLCATNAWSDVVTVVTPGRTRGRKLFVRCLAPVPSISCGSLLINGQDPRSDYWRYLPYIYKA